MPILISAELSSKGEILVKLLKKYVLIIYALGSVLACPGRSDSGVRREGSERKKIRGKRGSPSLSPLPHPLVVVVVVVVVVVFFSAHISLRCPHDLNAWNRLVWYMKSSASEIAVPKSLQMQNSRPG